MALVHITLCNVQARADTGATMPIPDSVEGAADTIERSGTSAQASIVAAAPSTLSGIGMVAPVSARACTLQRVIWTLSLIHI
ncbi:hypothetical protein [Sphingobium sp. B2]|uniref:hypothetical protein n=1 Tax=Sphingobium sp. B2 TaxID=2583228 RepID=UPI00119CE94F|nr:hypothetical protein [Sphingobium sp. B2]